MSGGIRLVASSRTAPRGISTPGLSGASATASSHFLQTAFEKRAASRHVAFQERLAGAGHQGRAMPDQRFGVLRVDFERALAALDRFAQPRVVAGDASEEIGANEMVEGLRGRRL